jgi:hypothetical protein
MVQSMAWDTVHDINTKQDPVRWHHQQLFPDLRESVQNEAGAAGPRINTLSFHCFCVRFLNWVIAFIAFLAFGLGSTLNIAFHAQLLLTTG